MGGKGSGHGGVGGTGSRDAPLTPGVSSEGPNWTQGPGPPEIVANATGGLDSPVPRVHRV